MTAGRGGGLYTPEILAAATGLAAYPYNDSLPLKGQARSRSCGSTITVALGTDSAGLVRSIGLLPHACAVGQAAASLFAGHVAGHSREDVAAARRDIAQWLAGDGPLPDWPGIALLAPALAYPARHPAILLAWDAALAAMPDPPLEPVEMRRGEAPGGNDGEYT